MPAKSSHTVIPNCAVTLSVFLLLTVLPVLHILVSQRTDLPLLIGDKTEALFDLWSFQHFFSGILIGAVLLHLWRVPPSWRKFTLLVLLLALLWEATELAMEAGFFGQAVSDWKNGYEHWGNRFIGDPLMVTLGGLFSLKFKSAWKWVLLPTCAWLIANIASPNSMSIQQLLFKP